MPELNEASIFEALGVTQQSEGAKEQDTAKTAGQEPENQEGEGAKEQDVADPAAGNGTPKEENPEQEGEQTKGEGSKGGLTEEQRKEYAAQRRRQEQKEAVEKAVNDALEKERERAKAEWSEFFKKASLKNTLTQKPITTLEEFNAWAADFEAAKLQRDLQAGKLTQEGLEKVIEKSPVMQRMKEIMEREDAANKDRAAKAAQEKIDEEIKEIQKLDPNIKATADLLKMQNAREFYEYVKKGNNFVDAYYLANRDRLASQTAEAAKQQTMNAARSKEHLNATGTARGAGASSVPAEEMEIFKLLNPNATEAEIQAYYNKAKK